MSGDEVELLRSGIVYGTHQHGDAGTVTVDITSEGIAASEPPRGAHRAPEQGACII